MTEQVQVAQEQVVRAEVRGAVAVVTLDRPQARNAVDLVLATQLGRALRAADDDPEVSAIVLTGAGPLHLIRGCSDLRRVRSAGIRTSCPHHAHNS